MNTITVKVTTDENSCELLSDFVYSFFEHNEALRLDNLDVL